MARTALFFIPLVCSAAAVSASQAKNSAVTKAKTVKPQSAFDVTSLPQVEAVTTFSATAIQSDPRCIATSMQFLTVDQYIQICGRNTVLPPAKSVAKRVQSLRQKQIQAGGEGEEGGAGGGEGGDGGENVKPDEGGKPGGDVDTGVSVPIQSYMQIMTRDSLTPVTQVVAADETTIYKSVTMWKGDKLLVSKAGSMELAIVAKDTLLDSSITDADNTVVTKFTIDVEPRGIAYDSANDKLYVTDGVLAKVHIYDGTFKKEKTIDISCGSAEIATTHLGDIVYVKPYLYIAIEGTSYVVRVDMTTDKCDPTWLIDFSTYTDDAFTEADKFISAIQMDTNTSEYTGTGFPKMTIVGSKWTKAYELSGSSGYIVNSIVIFGLTAFASFFSS